MNRILVCLPTANYAVTDDGMVIKSRDGNEWSVMGPIIDREQGEIAIEKACAVLAERQEAYNVLLKYNRQDITDAADWASENTNRPLAVPPSPIIAEIVKVFYECNKAKLLSCK